ncbi:MAG: permease [Rhodobacterales bacterium RIFCSPHIGHO2_02_FULL_62_130]|jgi:chloramphenicol-sensitive protein RarD|nr:MAG: permease [Rhodobacterales bacterium RIFCSPHIGHO2_02_FULL_62_130]OHC53757.1 MAG: permease [Rhodobacterales bacterium RIFCSPHIGHO2_12_FULL_62_75]HCZ01253.1 EamA family transporter RarD [Rhodobacter sp.]
MSNSPKNEDSRAGFGYALTAYLLWGALPIFMKAVAHISPAEVIAHRVIWSVPIAGAVLMWTGRLADLKTALRTPRMLAMGAATAALITINWGIYVWAIGAGHALDTALGYYINPLFSVFLGAVLLGERLSRAQKLAIALAALAVGVMTVDAGRLPLAALGLTVTWGFYAYLKKSLPIGPNQGFFLEVLILLVPALGYVGYLTATGTGHFMAGDTRDTVLLASCGLVTAVPLMIYANGAKLLRLSTIGIMQYISPTIIFLIAVFVFGEPFGTARMIAFPMIWAALAIYTTSLLRQARTR